LNEPCLGDLGRPRQRSRRQIRQRLVLGCHQGRNHAQEAFQLVPRGQCAKPPGTG